MYDVRCTCQHEGYFPAKFLFPGRWSPNLIAYVHLTLYKSRTGIPIYLNQGMGL